MFLLLLNSAELNMRSREKWNCYQICYLFTNLCYFKKSVEQNVKCLPSTDIDFPNKVATSYLVNTSNKKINNFICFNQLFVDIEIFWNNQVYLDNYITITLKWNKYHEVVTWLMVESVIPRWFLKRVQVCLLAVKSYQYLNKVNNQINLAVR